MIFVSTKTLARLADAGRIESLRLPSGHRRYPRRAIDDLLSQGKAA